MQRVTEWCRIMVIRCWRPVTIMHQVYGWPTLECRLVSVPRDDNTRIQLFDRTTACVGGIRSIDHHPIEPAQSARGYGETRWQFLLIIWFIQSGDVDVVPPGLLIFRHQLLLTLSWRDFALQWAFIRLHIVKGRRKVLLNINRTITCAFTRYIRRVLTSCKMVLHLPSPAFTDHVFSAPATERIRTLCFVKHL